MGVSWGAPARAFETGFNQGWIAEAYGHDFTRSWNAAETALAFERARAAGASVLRLWLFEGMEKDGVVFDDWTRATGLSPGFLANVEATCRIARRTGIRVYWTGLSGNWHWPLGTRWHHTHFNILNDKYGAGKTFRARALGPVLDLLARHKDTVFAFDVMNEVQGSVATWMWSDGWAGARRWMKSEIAFVKGRLPGVGVTASAGWASAADDLVAGRFSGLGLDFYDIHVYNDAGTIPRAFELRNLAWRTGTPLFLGEFGQESKRLDDALQARVTVNFLRAARSLGMFGALGWRLDDERPSQPGYVPYHSYYRDDRPRPAIAWLRWLSSGELRPRRASAWDYARGIVPP